MPRSKKQKNAPSSRSHRRKINAAKQSETIFDMKMKLKQAIKRHLRAMTDQGITFNTYLPLEELMSPSKKTLKNLQGRTGGMKRAQNGFILFRKDNQFRVQAEHPDVSQPEISKILKGRWATASPETKNIYMILSSIDFQAHKELFGENVNAENPECESASDKESTEDADTAPWKKFVTMPQMVLLPTSDNPNSENSRYLQSIFSQHTTQFHDENNGQETTSISQCHPNNFYNEIANQETTTISQTPSGIFDLDQQYNYLAQSIHYVTPIYDPAMESSDQFYMPSMVTQAIPSDTPVQGDLNTPYTQYLYSEIPLIESDYVHWPQ
ncbi:13739_t:CDS:1 [Acaulospora morrowiae]|uniref:13739_t:CDS:1 n=1 Tax=Acaulospora morrowiae TaxID=94023 RepID=A0A9N8Z5C7_9GLOM|nr:13739_t:CDS:1 [Acaulospora morrowiae]